MADKHHWAENDLCWAPDNDRVFAQAQVTNVAGDTITVKIAGNEIDIHDYMLLPRSREVTGVADMDDLDELHAASVLQNVETLFGKPSASSPGRGVAPIYSAVGPVLIALNPFEKLPIYEPEWVKAYRGASGNIARNKELGPHAYRTAEEAYAGLRKEKDQAVIICGESGAGKTVTNRKMIEYLCEVAQPASGEMNLGEAVTNANAFLEAFGNAKTTRNENSSRFGKFTKLSFSPDADYAMAGCSVEHYLLERSRVVAPNSLERNYHIFYQLLAVDSAKSAFSLAGKSKDDFRYTRNTSAVREMDDAKEYAEMIKQLKASGFSDEMVTGIQEAVAAVLHLGNVDFDADGEGSKVSSASRDSLDQASKLLGLDADALAQSLTQKRMAFGKEIIDKPIGTGDAANQRDTVAKTLYSRLFDKIVLTISEGLGKGSSGNQAVVGLLDIFGFEDMPINDFEQLFINLTNERIQLIFNDCMFKREKDALRQEGIEKDLGIDMDNEKCVNLFTGPGGIVRKLKDAGATRPKKKLTDEEKRRLDETFVSNLEKECKQDHEKYPHYRACGPKDARAVFEKKKHLGIKADDIFYTKCFLISHYAGEILYTVNVWAEKDNDTLFENVSDVVSKSSSKFVKDFFDVEGSSGGGKGTVGGKFTNQLDELATALSRGGSTFVRCIKTNPKQLPHLIDRVLVHEQLVKGGVMACLEIRKKGFPDRFEYAEFVEKFGFIANVKKGADPKEGAKSIFNVFGEDDSDYALGNTKIFMKTKCSSYLKRIALFRMNYMAMVLQSQMRIKYVGARVPQVHAACKAIADVEEWARSSGLLGIDAVDVALAKGKRHIEPIKEQLDKLEKDGELKSDRKNAAIAKVVPDSKMRELSHSLKEARDAVETTHQLKQEAETLFGRRFSYCTEQLDHHRTIVQGILATGEAMSGTIDPAELDAVKAACSAALDRCSQEELEKLRSEGIDRAFKESFLKVGEGGAPPTLDVTEDTVSPKMNELMEEVQTLVGKAVEQSACFEKKKDEFKQETAASVDQFEEISRQLSMLSNRVAQLDSEKRADIDGRLQDALTQQSACSDRLQEAHDVAAFQEAVGEFVKTVKAAGEMYAAIEKEVEAEQKKSSKPAPKPPIPGQPFDIYAPIFDAHDLDGNGVIEGDEYDALIRQLVMNSLDELGAKGKSGTPESVLAGWITAVLDPNHDRKITREEARVGLKKVLGDIESLYNQKNQRSSCVIC